MDDYTVQLNNALMAYTNGVLCLKTLPCSKLGANSGNAPLEVECIIVAFLFVASYEQCMASCLAIH